MQDLRLTAPCYFDPACSLWAQDLIVTAKKARMPQVRVRRSKRLGSGQPRCVAAPDPEAAEYNLDAIAPFFQEPGEGWSFAKIEQAGRAVELREKTRISPHATVGLYWFKSARDEIALYSRPDDFA